MWLHSSTYHPNLAASVPLPCIWGCISEVAFHVPALNPRRELHVVPQIPHLFALEAWQACPEKQRVTELTDPLCTVQNGYRPHSDQVYANSAVLGATFMTVKKDLHSQKLERTPPQGEHLCVLPTGLHDLQTKSIAGFTAKVAEKCSAFWHFASNNEMEQKLGTASALEGQL